MKRGRSPSHALIARGGRKILSLRAGREPSQEQVQHSNWSTSAKVALPYQEGKCSGVCLHVRDRAADSKRGGGESHASETGSQQTDEDRDTNEAAVEAFQRSTQSQGIQCFTAVETEK